MALPKGLIERIDEIGCGYRLLEPMARHTSFKIGGPAELYIEPDNRFQTAKLRKVFSMAGIPCYIFGKGSNLLVDDKGITGAVIAFGSRFSKIRREGNELIAQSGATLTELCRYAKQNGLSGLEFAYGIPGSVGGAIFMNAGAYGGEMKDVLKTVFILDEENRYCRLSLADAGLSYRYSSFQERDAVILGGRFSLTPDNPEKIEGRMNEVLLRRKEKQPLEYPSAGSAFKRPNNGYAAELIERCGLKGLTIGGAQISEKHAGFIINIGHATADDVQSLCQKVISRVCEETKVALEMEIKKI